MKLNKVKNGSVIGGKDAPYSFTKADNNFDELKTKRKKPYTQKQVLNAMSALHRMIEKQAKHYSKGKLYKAGIVENQEDQSEDLYNAAFELLKHLHDANDETGIQLCMSVVQHIIDLDDDDDEVSETSDTETSDTETSDTETSDTENRDKVTESVQPEDVPKASAYGGILMQGGKILLREPTNHFGGYAWTFAKGRVDDGEDPQEAALREVYEETGYHAKITGLVPGVFKGTTSTTAFFFMEPVGEPSEFGWETQDVKWVTKDEAIELIKQSPSRMAVTRDLEILNAAFGGKK